MARPIDRIGSGDLTELVTDVGPVPRHVGAVLVLDPVDPAALAGTVGARLATVRRFRQVLRRPVPGLGRPYWTDAPAAARDGLVTTVRLGSDSSDDLLALAAGIVATPLPTDRPLWRAVVVSQPSATALVLSLHHVLADGIGGLAVLARLADGPADRTAQAAGAPGPGTPAPPSRGEPGLSAPPGTRELLADAWRTRMRAVRELGPSVAGLRRGRRELAHRTGPGRAPRTSINAPTGTRRSLHRVEVELTGLLAAARAADATVNDCLLVAVTEALGTVLRRRGEQPEALVVSVLVSARAGTSATDLGNQVGVMPVRVPLHGSLAARLATVRAETSDRKGALRGSSAALLGPVFRGLARVGLFRFVIDRQPLVTTFLTNLRGPDAALTVAGAGLRSVVPVGSIAGNVAVAFAAMSYAGTLAVTVVTDPDVVPEGAALTGALGSALDRLSSAPRPPAAPGDA